MAETKICPVQPASYVCLVFTRPLEHYKYHFVFKTISLDLEGAFFTHFQNF